MNLCATGFQKLHAVFFNWAIFNNLVVLAGIERTHPFITWVHKDCSSCFIFSYKVLKPYELQDLYTRGVYWRKTKSQIIFKKILILKNKKRQSKDCQTKDTWWERQMLSQKIGRCSRIWTYPSLHIAKHSHISELCTECRHIIIIFQKNQDK